MCEIGGRPAAISAPCQHPLTAPPWEHSKAPGIFFPSEIHLYITVQPPALSGVELAGSRGKAGGLRVKASC